MEHSKTPSNSGKISIIHKNPAAGHHFYIKNCPIQLNINVLKEFLGLKNIKN